MRSFISIGPGLLFLPAYFLITIFIGWVSGRRRASSAQYLNATHALSLPIVVLAYIASNCGALEIVGLSAMAAHYGALAFHFYLIGAIPAMIFLAVWMMPLYQRNNVRSVPEYLLLRYGPGMRLLNACVTACMLLLLAGISLYAVGQMLTLTMGFTFEWGIVLCSAIVLIYVLSGGIRATIHNEVFQLAVMIAGLAPLAIRCIQASHHAPLPIDRLHLWQGMLLISPHTRMDVFGVVIGLGFVLSFGYWCTDFVMMQRAFAARTTDEACQVPLWAGFGKIAFSMLVVIPGLAAMRLLPDTGQQYNRALPRMMLLLYEPWLLGLGLTALAASLMSSLASNISAFAALWTEDIYRVVLRPGSSDAHYLRVARAAMIVAMAISLLSSYLNFLFRDLMEHIQLIFSVFGAPFWAVFLLGMFSRRTTERGAILGFSIGAACSFTHSVAVSRGLLHYGSVMTANFYAAIYAFCISMTFGWLLSSPRHEAALDHIERVRLNAKAVPRVSKTIWVLSGILLASAIAFNFLWY
jgi:SSS family solute:Na+ symporter